METDPPHKIIVEKNSNCDIKEGTYWNASDFHTIINNDADVYYYSEGKLKPLFFFRKKLLSNNDMKTLMNTFKTSAMKAYNNRRGFAAGPAVPEKISPRVKSVLSPGSHKTKVIYNDGRISKYYLSNKVHSIIAGYFDQAKVSDKKNLGNSMPCRTTVFTEKNTKKWDQILPVADKLDSYYKKFAPKKHSEQLGVASKTPQFQISNTAFSTITANYNWRTACHKDSGDYHNGFSVIVVGTEGQYTGGYLGYPQFGVAVNMEHGDFILKDPHQYHCNTEIISKTPYTRLSIIFYYREKIQHCKQQIGNSEIFKTKDGIILKIRPKTTDQKVIDEVLVKKVYQKPKLNFFQEKNELWLDLGANIGTFALHALNNGCRVVCYEPEKENFSMLQENLQNNFQTDWITHNVAVGTVKKNVDLYLCKGDYNKYRHTIYHKRGRQAVKVPMVSFKTEMNKYKPTGVKIDIEGAEIDILESVTPADWNQWNTKKLVFEYSFDIDPSIPRFIKIVERLEKYFTVVNYSKVKPNELVYNYFPAATMVYAIKI